MPKGTCFLYVAKRCQRHIHPLAINGSYKPGNDPAFSFDDEFSELGAIDMTPYMVVDDGMYRKMVFSGRHSDGLVSM